MKDYRFKVGGEATCQRKACKKSEACALKNEGSLRKEESLVRHEEWTLHTHKEKNSSDRTRLGCERGDLKGAGPNEASKWWGIAATAIRSLCASIIREPLYHQCGGLEAMLGTDCRIRGDVGCRNWTRDKKRV